MKILSRKAVSRLIQDIKKYTAITTTAIIVITSLAPSYAHAGFFDWAKTAKGDRAIVAADMASGMNWSFNGLYASVASFADLDQTDIAPFGANTSDSLPSKAAVQRKNTVVVEASAYSSTPDQTDASPFTTASGTQVRDGVIATNFLPFGTVIKIPALYGDKVFVVEDRMNKRYWHTIDLWFSSRELANQFGRKQVVIEIVSS